MEKDNMIIIKSFQELTNKEVYELLKLRFKGFVMEQGCHYLDPDGIDYSAIHIFIKNGDESMAGLCRVGGAIW